MRVALYVRVACPDQLALDCQTERLKAFADKHNLDMADVAAEVGSGMSVGRPALSRVETLATERNIDAVIAADRSRLFRDVFLFHDFESRLRNHGVRIFTLDRLQKLI